MNCVYLAMGSNLGDREAYLRAGMRGLVARGVRIMHCAAAYSTEPHGVLDQPWFLNTALEAQTDLNPDKLLSVCLEVEKENHRVRHAFRGPRTLDIDIIFYGNAIIGEHGLTIPHPSFSERRFVLAPLAEIAPDFRDPLSGKTIRELLELCPDKSTVVLAR